MAIAFVRQHQSTSNNTSGTTGLNLAIDAVNASVAGNTLIASIAFDNATATTPAVSSIAKPAGETNSWTKLGSEDSGTSTAGGGSRTEIWGIVTTVSWGAGTTYGVTLSSAVTPKLAQLAEFSGLSVTVAASAGQNNSATPAIAVTPSSGDLVIGSAALSLVGTITGDSDTTDGFWSSIVSTSVGSSTTGQQLGTQYKIVTGAVTQTWNPSSGASLVGVLVDLSPGANVFPVTVSATCTTILSLQRLGLKNVSVSCSTAVSVTVHKLKQVVISVTCTTSASVKRLASLVRGATISASPSVKRLGLIGTHATASTNVTVSRVSLLSIKATASTAVSVAVSFIRKPFALLVSATRGIAALTSKQSKTATLSSSTSGTSNLDGAP